MSDSNAADDLTFEATVPMTREALIAHVLRRCGNVWGQTSMVGPVGAWKTEAGFRLRRVGLFRSANWTTLEAEVEDLGGSCRITGRVVFDDGWPIPRLIFGLVHAAFFAFFAQMIARSLWAGSGNPGGFLIGMLFASSGAAGALKAWRAPLHFAANRAFLIERLEGMIGVPVTVRRAGGAP